MDLKRDSRKRDQPGQNLVELDFQLWKPERTDFRKSETTFPRHYTMLEEEENLTIEKNTVPLSEDTTNIMEMIENVAFDLTLPEPLPTTTLHITDHKAEVEQMVEVNDTA